MAPGYCSSRAAPQAATNPVPGRSGPARVTPDPATWSFRAMSTDVEVVGAPQDPAPWFERLERLWSRFDAASALSQLNRWAGRWMAVPPLLHLAIRRALAAARLTGGAFDPTVLPALLAAGYGRSFELGPTEPGPAVPAGRWREVCLGPGAVFLPEGVALDLGGIGKGLAVDLVLRRLRRGRTAASLLVNAGGDLALWAREGDPPWLVEVADPFAPEQVLAAASLRRGAVATSSTLGRRWGADRHHIIDPATGRPVNSDLVAATVFAPTAARAEVLAKACLVLGAERALRLLATRGCRGLLVTAERGLILTPGLEEFLYVNAE